MKKGEPPPNYKNPFVKMLTALWLIAPELKYSSCCGGEIIYLNTKEEILLVLENETEKKD